MDRRRQNYIPPTSSGDNKIVGTSMPVNLYHDSKVSLRWLHEKGDFDIIQAS